MYLFHSYFVFYLPFTETFVFRTTRRNKNSLVAQKLSRFSLFAVDYSDIMNKSLWNVLVLQWNNFILCELQKIIKFGAQKNVLKKTRFCSEILNFYKAKEKSNVCKIIQWNIQIKFVLTDTRAPTHIKFCNRLLNRDFIQCFKKTFIRVVLNRSWEKIRQVQNMDHRAELLLLF